MGSFTRLPALYKAPCSPKNFYTTNIDIHTCRYLVIRHMEGNMCVMVCRFSFDSTEIVALIKKNVILWEVQGSRLGLYAEWRQKCKCWVNATCRKQSKKVSFKCQNLFIVKQACLSHYCKVYFSWSSSVCGTQSVNAVEYFFSLLSSI